MIIAGDAWYSLSEKYCPIYWLAHLYNNWYPLYYSKYDDERNQAGKLFHYLLIL